MMILLLLMMRKQGHQFVLMMMMKEHQKVVEDAMHVVESMSFVEWELMTMRRRKKERS